MKLAKVNTSLINTFQKTFEQKMLVFTNLNTQRFFLQNTEAFGYSFYRFTK